MCVPGLHMKRIMLIQMMNVMKWYEPAFSGHGFRRRHELASRCTLAQEQDPKGMVCVRVCMHTYVRT